MGHKPTVITPSGRFAFPKPGLNAPAPGAIVAGAAGAGLSSIASGIASAAQQRNQLNRFAESFEDDPQIASLLRSQAGSIPLFGGAGGGTGSRGSGSALSNEIFSFALDQSKAKSRQEERIALTNLQHRNTVERLGISFGNVQDNIRLTASLRGGGDTIGEGPLAVHLGLPPQATEADIMGATQRLLASDAPQEEKDLVMSLGLNEFSDAAIKVLLPEEEGIDRSAMVRDFATARDVDELFVFEAKWRGLGAPASLLTAMRKVAMDRLDPDAEPFSEGDLEELSARMQDPTVSPAQKGLELGLAQIRGAPAGSLNSIRPPSIPRPTAGDVVSKEQHAAAVARNQANKEGLTPQEIEDGEFGEFGVIPIRRPDSAGADKKRREMLLDPVIIRMFEEQQAEREALNPDGVPQIPQLPQGPPAAASPDLFPQEKPPIPVIAPPPQLTDDEILRRIGRKK